MSSCGSRNGNSLGGVRGAREAAAARSRTAGNYLTWKQPGCFHRWYARSVSIKYKVYRHYIVESLLMHTNLMSKWSYS